jgi:hypothetical protein
MSELRHLVEALRGLTDDVLRRLVTTRLVQLTSVEDLYALAEILNHPKSYASQIGSLSKKQLENIAKISVGESVPKTAVSNLLELQLVYQTEDGLRVFSGLLEQLNQHKVFTRPLFVVTEDDAPADVSAINRDAGLVAFETMQAITEIVFDVEKHLIREVGKGGVGLPDVKRLATALAKPNDYAKRMFSLASRLGLTTIQDGRHRLTPAANVWLDSNQLVRVEKLLVNFRELLGRELAAGISEIKAGASLPLWLASNYPLAANAPGSRIGQILESAESFGLAVGSRATEWFGLAIQNHKLLGSVIEKYLPNVQERIILQADLSVISPGPLPTNLEAMLRLFANTESIGLASTYRLSAISVCHGLETGLSIEQIRGFLEKSSGAKLPQPVDYLLNEVTSRFGRLVIAEIADSSDRSMITSTDELLLTEIGNDPRLRAFSLTRPSAGSIVCRFEPSVVYFGLRECGYLAIRKSMDGVVINPISTADTVDLAGKASTIDADIKRIREADKSMSSGGSDEAITRQVQLAIRNKARLLITATLPNGTESTFDLMPSGIANGRLRGLDRKAQIERTLPLSTITAISLA